MIEVLKIDLRLNTRADARSLVNGGFDEIVIATGITPRTPDIAGIDHPMVASYVDVINGKAKVGKKVALIGAGGIGFDVAELVSHAGVSASMDVDVFAAEWGIDFKNHPRGGVTGVVPHVEKADRTVTLLQRKAESLGRSLGKTTGWTHKATLQKRGVQMIGGVTYEKIDDAGLHVLIGTEPRLIEADTVIICAGQDPLRALHDELAALGVASTLVGGSDVAAELDAKRAINQASRLAAAI
jgi:2,4-dienoyl-CoA reductase (NADPH2)